MPIAPGSRWGACLVVRKFNLLRNVGKFDNVAAGAQLPFSRLTVIYAENARGKTTLAAILRRSHRVGRSSLPSERGSVPHILLTWSLTPAPARLPFSKAALGPAPLPR